MLSETGRQWRSIIALKQEPRICMDLSGESRPGTSKKRVHPFCKGGCFRFSSTKGGMKLLVVLLMVQKS